MLLMGESHHHSIIRVQNCRIEMVVKKRSRKWSENQEQHYYHQRWVVLKVQLEDWQ